MMPLICICSYDMSINQIVSATLQNKRLMTPRLPIPKQVTN